METRKKSYWTYFLCFFNVTKIWMDNRQSLLQAGYWDTLVFQANVAQTLTAQTGIQLMLSILPAILAGHLSTFHHFLSIIRRKTTRQLKMTLMTKEISINNIRFRTFNYEYNSNKSRFKTYKNRT